MTAIEDAERAERARSFELQKWILKKYNNFLCSNTTGSSKVPLPSSANFESPVGWLVGWFAVCRLTFKVIYFELGMTEDGKPQVLNVRVSQ